MARAALRIEATASPSSWMGGISKDTGREKSGKERGRGTEERVSRVIRSQWSGTTSDNKGGCGRGRMVC